MKRCCFIKKNGDLLGTRLKATVLSELRLLKKFNKILSLATYIV
ncbi:MAG: uL14 family ribosomal protein [Richelia sp. SM2_1_7]|nr:uL14 family ribosomal protein [Richelia sp. SM2_1_7]